MLEGGRRIGGSFSKPGLDLLVLIALGRHVHGKHRPLRRKYEFSPGEVNGEAAAAGMKEGSV